MINKKIICSILVIAMLFTQLLAFTACERIDPSEVDKPIVNEDTDDEPDVTEETDNNNEEETEDIEESEETIDYEWIYDIRVNYGDRDNWEEEIIFPDKEGIIHLNRNNFMLTISERLKTDDYSKPLNEGQLEDYVRHMTIVNYDNYNTDGLAAAGTIVSANSYEFLDVPFDTEIIIEVTDELKEKLGWKTNSIIIIVEEIEISNSWDMDIDNLTAEVVYFVPDYTPNVKPYAVEPDFSNVHNMNQFSGFTENQLKSLYEDGFVILKPGNDNNLKMHHLYEKLEYNYAPSFITVDSALHLYHLFFNDSLKYLEMNVLHNNLQQLSKNMLNKSLKYYNDEKYTELKEDIKIITAYFAVANILLGETVDLPTEIQTLVDEELKLISDTSSIIDSPILGHKLDYSQFIVRGHYTGNEVLEKYFKTMMWYGQGAFPLTKRDNGEEILLVDSTIKALIMTSLVFEDTNNTSDFRIWNDIYDVTALYAGNSDDLSIVDYRDMITNVYGENPDMLLYKDTSYYDKLLEEAKKMASPQINAKTADGSILTGKQFRFMGQRYTLDANIMQDLMEPYLRPVPSGLDVAAAFGSERAEEILGEYYEPQLMWEGYEGKLNELTEKVDNLTEEAWKSNLYSGWLWMLESTLASYENTDGMPPFMQSPKWTDKNINSMLGSYAELKHDTVLYNKQPVAEMGGLMTIPYNYVEPNIEVYSKLLWLTKNTKANLEIKDLVDEDMTRLLDNIVEMVDILLTCSLKELNNEPFTEDENYRLNAYGGFLEYITLELNYCLENYDLPYTTSLISDVATITDPHCFLEIGTGFSHEIYVLCNYGDTIYLAKGALFSYYEFLSDERLTDEQWFEMLGIKKTCIDEQYGFYDIGVDISSQNIPPLPQWTETFISDEENNVRIESVEINWDLKVDEDQ